MSAYVIAKVKVTDWDGYKEYMKLTPATVEKFGGRFVVRGGQMITLEGPETTERIVLIEFTSLEKAKEWYHSSPSFSTFTRFFLKQKAFINFCTI
jgi:uncharacterized protein (DUF1330 family)